MSKEIYCKFPYSFFITLYSYHNTFNTCSLIFSSSSFIITTSRFVRDYCAGKGWVAELEKSGVTIVCDICSYYSPGLDAMKGRVMTNSAKWAYYAPGMLPVEVCFGSLSECVESAIKGEVVRDARMWSEIT